MKALCLQLSIALCVTLSFQSVQAQLTINCPDGTPQPFICNEDVPPQAGDSLGFLSLPGTSISGVTGKLTIDYSDFSPPESTGCFGDEINRIRIFRFTDESDAEEIMCNIRFRIERPENGDASRANCNDVLVTLDSNGEAVLEPSDIVFTTDFLCSGSAFVRGLSISNFSCADAEMGSVADTLFLENECGEPVNCYFDVIVVDTTKPELECPSNILVDLDPCVCETVVDFPMPSVSDECEGEGGVTLERLDNTGLNSGDFFPQGLTTLSYLATDNAGNTSTCNLQIRVNSSDPGSIFCNVNQNISLNEECSAKVTPQMMVKDPACDIDSYRITLFDSQGNQLPSDTITANYLGQVVTARATYECYENSCSVDFNVEDKMPPMISCSNMTISCSDFIDFPLPTISDNCGTFSPVLLNQSLLDVACDSANIDKIITRTYGVKDESGEIVERCEQRLSIQKFDIAEVEAPELVVMIACDSAMVFDENGNPDPIITGAPSLNGIDLYPQKDLFCNVALSYEDMVFQGNGCGTSLLRTWTVMNWYCGEDGMRTFKQSINLIDTVGPEFEEIADITISSASNSCETPYEIVAPALSDNCQSDLVLDIIYPGGIAFDTNRASAILDLGENVITFRGNDQCGNVSEVTQTITVMDQVQPIAVCESGMTFSLDGNGMAILRASTFDNGSLDACSDALLEIAKVSDNCGIEDNTVFGSDVILCCEDVGSDVMIVLRVTDDEGNSNQCMASIQVVDGSKPVLQSGLPDITISNDYLIDTSDLTAFGIVEQNVEFPGNILLEAEIVVFDGPSVNASVKDNCSVNEVVESKQVDINMCHTGEILRTFVIYDGSGGQDSIFQQITIVAEREFSESDITWPGDTTFNNICSPDLNPLSMNSFPVYDEGFNSMVSYTKEDSFSYISPGCFMVKRIWYVSDWCNRIDGLTFNTYIDTQRIVVLDQIPPEILSACGDTTICSLVSNCGDHPVDFSASGSDNCTAEIDLEWSYTVVFADGRPDSLGEGNNFSGKLPLGLNTINWTVDDGCGNTDACAYEVLIESCLNPQPICLLGQKFYIEPIDTSGDTIPDINGVMVTSSMIDGGSNHPCNKKVAVSFSQDVNDTVRVFTCDDIGDVPVMLFATDEDGRFDFCNAMLSVQDTSSSMLCGMGLVAGVVFGNEIDFVQGASVKLIGSDLETMTDESGIFAFPEMSPGGAYSVVPSKLDHPLNGVSSADLVLMQRHILNIQTFESPYKLIAADVNESGNISAADLIAMRKLILGLSDAFPSGKTWKFIPGNHVFLDPQNPWSNPIPEQYDIHNLVGQNDLDFIGVKLGDLNQSAEMNGLLGTKRSVEVLSYRVKEGELELIAEEDMDFAALVVEVMIDKKYLELLSLENRQNSMVLNHNYTKGGLLKILLNSPRDVSYKKGDVILNIEFEQNFAAEILAHIDFNQSASEIAFENGSSSALQIRYGGDAKKMVLKQNTPNPWTSSTAVEMIMPSDEVVTFRILDLSGKEVSRKQIALMKGENSIEIKDTELPSIGGMYFYELSSSLGVESRKMMLIAR